MPQQHVPTPDQRKQVEAMAACGTPQDDIALFLDIAPKTLRKAYPNELKLGMIKANAAVGGALFTLATKAGPGQVSAAIFWTKVRMGWKEPAQTVAVTNPDGTPLEIKSITRVIIDPTPKTSAQAGQGSRSPGGKAEREKTVTATVKEGLRKSPRKKSA